MNSSIPFFKNLMAPQRAVVAGLAVLLIVFSSAGVSRSQEVGDTIRINTRVVFLDALVKDKRTGVPISDLKPENFEVLDDGNARPISYFTREGQARKPLALVLILDLRDDGAGRFLKNAEILKTMGDELAKLSPNDEVAILAMGLNGADAKRVWLTGFTRDHAQLVAALARAPQFIGVTPGVIDDRADAQNKKTDEHGSSLTIGSDSSKTTAKDSSGPGPGTPQSEQPEQVEVVKGKNGAVVTRTTRPDGSVNIKRVNKKGDVTMELGDIYDMAAAVREVTRRTQAERPDSQAALVWVSDGITPMFIEDRDATEELVLRSNVIFNSLTVELRTLFKFLLPIGKPIAGMLGVSIYGSAKRLAQKSGGEAVKVSRTKDYATGLSKIIGNLTARYSLGFALAENEKYDGRLHNLEVRVKAQDAKGKLRKLEVSSRQGYYMTEAGEREAKEAAAAKPTEAH